MHRLGTTLNHRRESLCLEQGEVTKAYFLNRQRNHRGNRSVSSSDGLIVPKEVLPSFPDETTFQSSLSVCLCSRKLISTDMWKSARTLLCVHTWFDIVFCFFSWFICNSFFLDSIKAWTSQFMQLSTRLPRSHFTAQRKQDAPRDKTPGKRSI